ncbi:MAG TPA: CDP-alcohol phosphatidyltransferase family protein [Pseudonocardiaceae bacterium]|nr:CDP-alcohol phosphatidyltransferase family protein [Pseudonocardiaceae bacterium]
MTTRNLYGGALPAEELSVATAIQLTVAAAVQFGLLVSLSVTVGLHPAGWLVGVAFGIGTWLLLVFGMRGARSLGAANIVTLARTILIGGVTALVTDSINHHVPMVVVIAIASVALSLDAVDGYVARSTGTTTRLGARFDMEADAFLILVLSGYVALTLGPWVLGIGLMRYAFVAAGWVLPWLRVALPPTFPRKAVAAIQGIALAVVGIGFLPTPIGVLVVAIALALLVWSFGRDIFWLWQRRTVRS